MTKPHTFSSWCVAASGQLSNSSSAQLDAEVLLCHTLGINRATLYAWPDKVIEEADLPLLERQLGEREKGKPIAYITGRKEFWSLDLHVSPDVLIPRSDTETLVEYAIETYHKTGGSILELGTGSGAIAIALAHELQIPVTASDISKAALNIASANAERLAPGLINFVHGNWGDPFASDTFQIIVSNPPYIDKNDQHLSKPELQFEPSSALTSGEQGLADLERIIIDASRIGCTGCRVILEHGYTQAAQVREIMRNNDYTDIISKLDLVGHERLTAGTCKPSMPFSRATDH